LEGDLKFSASPAVKRLKMTIVTKEEVTDSRSALIGHGQGRVKEIFGNTDNFTTQTKARNIKKRRKRLPRR